MISAMETEQNEVMQAMADAQQACISAMLAGSTYPAATKVVIGSTVALPIADTKEVLMERANVAALKLQGILKASKKARKAPISHQCWPLTDENYAPIVLVCASVRTAQIGGTSMGMYSGLSSTELDSHANKAVAGSKTTVIARSGTFANVTTFSKDLPAMDMVEIGDAAMCYDDPISLVTYILVMKNALLIPSTGHNLIPPFLIWEAGLLLDETPKHQTPYPMIENHSIWDQRSGLRIHLQLNGIFSYFKTWPLTLEEQENWEDYQVVYVFPDGDS